MLEVAILRVLLLQAINSRTPCSPWIPVSPKRSGRPCKATYHHGPPTCTHWAATGCPSRTGTASKASWCGWSPAAHGTSQPGCRVGRATAPGPPQNRTCDFHRIRLKQACEDPLSQTPYVLLDGLPVDRKPVGGSVLRSVQHADTRQRR